MKYNRYFITHSKKDDGSLNVKVYKNGEVIEVFDVSDESSLNETINKYRDNLTNYIAVHVWSLDSPRCILNDDLIVFNDFEGYSYYILDKTQDKVGLVSIDNLRMSIKTKDCTKLANMIKDYVIGSDMYEVSLNHGVFSIKLDGNITIKMTSDDIKKLFSLTNEDKIHQPACCHLCSMSSTKKAIVNEFGEIYMYTTDELRELKRALHEYMENGDYTKPSIFDVCGVLHNIRWNFGRLLISANSVTHPFIFSIKSVDDLDVKSSIINNGNFALFYSPKKDSVVTITVENYTFSVKDGAIDTLFSSIINHNTDNDDTITIVNDKKVEFYITSTDGDIVRGVSSRHSTDSYYEYDIVFMPHSEDDEYLGVLYKDDIIEYLKTRNILN